MTADEKSAYEEDLQQLEASLGNLQQRVRKMGPSLDECATN